MSNHRPPRLTFPRRAAAGALLALVAGCAGGATGPSVTRAEWQATYLSARDALEAGRAADAARAYARIVPHSGPVEPRVRLEYAHALLRGGAFPAAAEEARRAASGQSGSARAAALAVAAVAEHEAARIELEAGRADAELAAALAEAGATLDRALAAGGGIDAEGVLSARRQAIAAEAEELRQKLNL